MGRMASHLGQRNMTSATNDPSLSVDLRRERDARRLKANNNPRTLTYEEPVRLRNACDLCHQLKRKCSGQMPCENCILSDSSHLCFYRPTNRLGRPRGSKNRHKSSMHSRSDSTQHQAAAPGRQHNASPPIADPISSNAEQMDHFLPRDMDWDCLLNEDLLASLSSANSEMTTAALPQSKVVDRHSGSCPNPTNSPCSTGMDPIFGTLSHEQPFLEQQSHQQQLPEWERFPSPPDTQHPGPSPGDNSGHDDEETRHRTPSLSPSCQCAQGLRSLLASLSESPSSPSSGSRTSQASGRQPYPMDTVFSNATRALEQWTALESCNCCSSTTGKEQQVENLFLLTSLSVQCVLTQLRSLTSSSDPAAAACLRLGNFDITGQSRATVLSTLCVTIMQEIERVVEGLRCKINEPPTANKSGGTLLAYIDVLFGHLTIDIRTLQQQQRLASVGA